MMLTRSLLPALPWALTGLLALPVFSILYKSRWEDIDYTHAYFILPLSLFLIWRDRQRLVAAPRSFTRMSDATASLAVMLSLVIFIFGWKLDYVFLSTAALIPLAFGLAALLYGTTVTRLCAFPILYLAFLIPPPLGLIDELTLPLRYGVSMMTEQILQWIHYPVTRTGLLLTVGGEDVYLGEACSGFRSIVTLGSLGAAYIYLSQAPARHKALLAASIIPIAVVGNLTRVVSVCIVTYHLGQTEGQKFYHDFSGFVAFAIMLIGLFALEKLLARRTAISERS